MGVSKSSFAQNYNVNVGLPVTAKDHVQYAFLDYSQFPLSGVIGVSNSSISIKIIN